MTVKIVALSSKPLSRNHCHKAPYCSRTQQRNGGGSWSTIMWSWWYKNGVQNPFGWAAYNHRIMTKINWKISAFNVV